MPFVVCGLLILLMVIIRFGAVEIRRLKHDHVEIPQASIDALKRAVRTCLMDQHIPWNILPADANHRERWHAHVPTNVPLPTVHLAIQDSVHGCHGQILIAESEPVSHRVILHIGLMDSCLFVVDLRPAEDSKPRKGKIALIIDDFGDHWDETRKAYIRLNRNLTYSIMPGRRFSRQTASEMIRAGYEIIMHLPMEPQNAAFKNDGYMVLADMDREAIRRTIRKSLEEVPGAAGVNNHMGSRTTSDKRVMEDVLEEIRKRGLYFVDSRTTAETVAYDTAQRMGIPSGERDVFLDTSLDKEAIRRSLWETARTAERKGFAVGIGHCHKNMIEVLEEELTRLEREGFLLVSISEIVH